jgi:hypothetical protein
VIVKGVPDMTNGNKEQKAEFRILLVTGVICAVVGTLLGCIGSYAVMRSQLQIERADRVNEDKLKRLSDSLRSVAKAKDEADGHNGFDPAVTDYITKAGDFCKEYVDPGKKDKWNSYLPFNNGFRTQFEGLYYMVCHTVDFYTADGSKGIPANAYQFVEPNFLRDVATEVDATILSQ